MNRHYVLSIDPQADCEWERCVLRNPITGERPDLEKAIADKVKNRSGSYLIRVNINVEILEQTASACATDSSYNADNISEMSLL